MSERRYRVICVPRQDGYPDIYTDSFLRAMFHFYRRYRRFKHFVEVRFYDRRDKTEIVKK